MTSMFANHPEHEREMLESAYDAVTMIEAWEFLKNYDPPQDRGFMWDSNPRVNEISNKINELYGGHSGASLAFVMRKMQSIAINNAWRRNTEQ